MSLEPVRAILLLGPTGSGKTPLGDHLEKHGVWGRRCRHFDFGRALRQAVAGRDRPPVWTEDDTAFVRAMLEQGALLEEKHFHIAERLLTAYRQRRSSARADVLILNGWPRHVGQARTVDRTVAVGLVVRLACDDEAVRARIARDTGGDRRDRRDDSPAAIVRKLEIYRQRTEPLLEHYRARGAAIATLLSDGETQAEDAARQLARTPDPWRADG
jgi:adenylate kinase